MKIKNLLSRIPALFAIALFACSGGDDSPHAPEGKLLPADEVYDATAEELRLREMQYIRIEDADDPTRFEIWDSAAPGAADVISKVLGGVSFLGCFQANECEQRECQVTAELANGTQLLDLAQGITTYVVVVTAEFWNQRTPALVSPPVLTANDNMVVKPQSAPTRAALARIATARFRTAIENAIDGLEYAANPSTGGLCYQIGQERLDELGHKSAIGFQEAIIKLEEASLLHATLSVAVADQQLGSSTQAAISTARGMAGSSLSRAAAGHALVGGIPGVQGNTTRASCSSAEMSKQAKMAVEIIRDLAPPPDRILETSSTLTIDGDGTVLQAFLNGNDAGDADGSLRQRFLAFHGITLEPQEALEEHFGLQRQDFAEAINYLADEIRTFSRSRHQKVSVSDSDPVYDRYAGVARPPTDLPDAYWGAVARTGVEPNRDEDWQWANSASYAPWRDEGDDPNSLPPSLSDALSWAATWAVRELRDANGEVSSTLAAALSNNESLGLFEHWVPAFFDDSEVFRMNVFSDGGENAGDIAAGDYYVALGDDALKCAVLGDVEGEENCDPYHMAEHLTELTPFYRPTLHRMAYQTTPEPGFGKSLVASVRAGSRRVYLLRVRPSWTATPTQLSPGRGDFEAVVGMAAHRPIPYGIVPLSGVVNSVGVVPHVERTAAQHLRLATEDCTNSLLSCGEDYFDERLPLENELSDDGDGVETSWRYYLTQAAEAAAESDALAREYIETELSQSTRAETLDERKRAQEEKAMQELDGLQSICGTSVDVTTLLKFLGWDQASGELAEPSVPSSFGSCTSSTAAPGFQCIGGTNVFDVNCDGPGDVAENYICVNGRQIRLWTRIASGSQDPEMQKLQKCVANFSLTRPYMHISTQPVCFDPDVRVAVPRSGCEPGMIELSEAESFGFLEITEPFTSDKTPACEAIRRARRWINGTGTLNPNETGQSVLELIQQSGLFSKSNLENIRSQLVVEAKYGGYVDVILGGSQWFTTGSALGGGATSWPCGSVGMPDDCDGGEHESVGERPIACTYYQCGHLVHPAETGRINDRVLDAFVALELMSQPFDSPNESEVSNILFWWPVLLANNLPPKGYGASRPFPVWQGDQFYTNIDERSNDMWKMYSPNDIPAPYDTAFRRRGVNYPIQGMKAFSDVRANALPQLAYNFAVGRRVGGAVEKQETIGAFFGHIGGGLNNQSNYVPTACEDGSLSGRDYFSSRLLSVANPSIAHLGALNSIHECLDWDMSDPNKNSIFPSYNLSDRLLVSGEDCDPGAFGAFLEYLTYNAVGNYLEPYGLAIDEPVFNDYTYDITAACAEKIVYPVGDNLNLYENERAMWDAIELVCEATKRVDGEVPCIAPPEVRSSSDLPKIAAFLECKADEIKNNAAGAIFSDVPEIVYAHVRDDTGPQSLPGEMGQAVSEAIEAIHSLSDTGEELNRIFKGFAVEMRQIDRRIRNENLEDKISQLNLSATIANNITSCATAMTSASNWGDTVFKNGSELAAAAITCTNAIIQSNIAAKISEVEQEINDNQRDIIFGDGETEFLRLERALADESDRVRDEVARAQRALSTIESLAQQARRSVDRAVWHLSYQNEKSEVVTNVLSAQALTARARYESAHRNAKRWAFLARRAIEQRLGVSLDSMFDVLPLVEAPGLWVNSVCATSPVDYDAVSEGSDYADAFIGDYVQKLENVVESYRLQFGFQDGADTAVVSLRDDVLNVRADCEVLSKNLLYHASGLDLALRKAGAMEGAWTILGCPSNDDEGSDALCLSVDVEGAPFNAKDSPLSGVPGFRLTFDDGGTDACEGSGMGGAPGYTCAWNQEVRLAQQVVLKPGSYRFSWYAPPDDTLNDEEALATAGGAWDVMGEPMDPAATYYTIPAVILNGHVITWDRHYLEFTVGETTAVSVGFSLDSSAAQNQASDWYDRWELDVAAPMLERINPFAETDEPPSRFSNTRGTLTETQAACEDTDGDEFRERWSQPVCTRVCPEGFGDQCASTAVRQCYREVSFYIDQASIEQGSSLVYSGFARGNFNYRIQSVGLNFVGTGLKDCADSTLPSTCYSGGFVPYSLYHRGPYFVRNHYGQNYRAHLFEGVVEHARGLAAERYLSNPISSTDRDLLTDYTRLEYQGRPLDGQFTLRVWDEPGVRFDQLEDVQVVLNYQYWTR